MVAKKIAGTAGAAAGGFLNNPGAIIATLGITGIITALLIFRKDITNFFGGAFGEAAVEGAGAAISSGLSSAGQGITEFFTNIELPTFELPSFDFTLPTIEFPSFEDIFGQPSDGGDFTDVGMAGARARQDDSGLTPAELFGIEERGAIDPRLSAITTFGEGAVEVEQMQTLGAPRLDEPFAVTNVEETQAEFQERSQLFAEAFPNIAFSTSLTDEITTGRQLSRESEDFESVLEAEARRSESIFAALFGNVQNPEFGA